MALYLVSIRILYHTFYHNVATLQFNIHLDLEIVCYVRGPVNPGVIIIVRLILYFYKEFKALEKPWAWKFRKP